MFTLFKDLKPEDRFVALLATLIVCSFLLVAAVSMFFPIKADADIKQTLIAIVMLAVGYYLGSSSGSKKKDDMIQPPKV